MGAMKLGRDVIVLTQTAETRSVAFLSQSSNDGKDVSCHQLLLLSLVSFYFGLVN